MSKQTLFSFLALCLLGGATFLTTVWISPPAPLPAEVPAMRPAVEPLAHAPEHIVDPGRGCTAFCLDNGDHCVFGANLDNSVESGLLFINKRHVLKTTWDPSTSGEYARWVSRYGSATVNLVAYQMAWAGMNEAGLMISTMSLPETQGPIPDERPPFEGPLWMQYQLDNHSTVDQVIASDGEIRLVESTVDHYLVCDRTGACASIEFLEGELVYHTGESLPVKALTNSTYRESVSTWEQSQRHANLQNENSLWRFVVAADRDGAFEPSTSDAAVAYAFDTLEAVSGDNTVWSLVFDPVDSRVHFRTNRNPRIRYLDLAALDFSCRTPVRLMDVHADLSGDVSDALVAYTHKASFAHSIAFFTQYEGYTMSPLLVDTLLWGLESFRCQDGGSFTEDNLVRYRPVLPPAVAWAGLTILHRVGPFWIPLLVLSLACLVWRMRLGQPASLGKRLVWVLVTIILGPVGLLAYVLARWKKHQTARPT